MAPSARSPDPHPAVPAVPLAALIGGLVAALLAAGCARPPPAAEAIPGSRPGLTDDPVAVAAGSLQAEAGVDVGRLAGDDYAAGELLLRLGVAGGVEARLGLASHGGRGSGAPAQALEDVGLGFKFRLAREGEGLLAPAMALLPSLTLPTGAERLTAGGVEPGALLVAGWEGAGVQWTANLGGTAARGADGRVAELFLGVAVGRAISERLELEVEGVRTAARGDPGLRHAAVGFAWLVHPDLQLDGWAGLQREGDARGRFLGIGISARR
jgi:hypothetical protein